MKNVSRFFSRFRSSASSQSGLSSPLPPTKISARGLEKSFEGKPVLEGIDLDIEAGQSFAIVGRSGVGKSVLMKCLLGLLRPDRGEVFIDGQPLQPSQAQRAKMGIVFQGGALFDSLNVWQNVAFRLTNAEGVKKRDARKRAIECLNAVELSENVADLSLSELSGGMRKRVAVARTLASEPEILFFDEPTSGLDPITTAIVDDLIISCSKALGSTTVTITHDMTSVYKIADHVALLFEGKIVWQGSKHAMTNSQDPYVQQFVRGRAEGPMTTARKAAGDAGTSEEERLVRL